MGLDQIQTRSVEAALNPLLKQIRRLVNGHGKRGRRKGESKKALILVQALEVANENFVWRGESLADEVPEAKQDVVQAVDNIRLCGSAMSQSARDFAADPCSQEKRGRMVVDARQLLSAVARLLIIADMIDVHLLMSFVYKVNADLDFIRVLKSPTELMEGMKRLQLSTDELSTKAGQRQAELKDQEAQESLASARAVLKKTTPLLFTACNVHVRYPDMKKTGQNRDLVLKDVCRAVDTIGSVAEGKLRPTQQELFQQSVLQQLSELKLCLQNNPDWAQSARSIEKSLDGLIKRSEEIFNREKSQEKQEKLERLCEELKKCYTTHPTAQRVELEQAGQRLLRLLDVFAALLRRTIYSQVSDQFLELGRPVNSLMSAARKSRKDLLPEKVNLFRKQSQGLVNVANSALELDIQDDRRKLIKLAIQQLQGLEEEVVLAAEILADIPNSKAALENSELFKAAWINQVRILVDAVDEIIPLEQCLEVLENQIITDVRACCKALEKGQSKELNQSARSVYHRTLRVCDLAVADLENYEEGQHSVDLRDTVLRTKKEIFPVFSSRVQQAIQTLREGKDVDENEFIESTRLVYNSVREIRGVVSMYSTPNDEEMVDTDWESLEDDPSPKPKLKSIEHASCTEVTEKKNIRDAVTSIPEAEKLEIAKELEIDSHVYWVAIWSNPKVRNLLSTSQLGGSQVEGFHEEKVKFEEEVDKWEDSQNDIVLLAKHMCRIMTDMTDFIKGRGPIKCTEDIITSAKKISDSGKKLDGLARNIADGCPESSTKSDLLAYLQRIALYCHQLNITSKVKADVHNVSAEFIVSGLDSACSLIQAARNLMNAVVLTVKASYVASRMYKHIQLEPGKALNAPAVVWKMKTPEKQPLVRREAPEDFRAKVKRYSRKEQTSPMKALSEFEEDTFSFSATSTESLHSTVQ